MVLNDVRKRNPVYLFVMFNWFFSMGTLFNLEKNNAADGEHAYFLIFASVSIFFTVFLLFNRKRYRRTEQIFQIRLAGLYIQSNLLVTWVLLILSVVISYIYFTYLVGYNLFLPALMGADLDFTTMRLESYAGENYTGAGIINQFKNTILPITFSAIVFGFANKRSWIPLILFVALVGPVLLWCLLGTGQRTFLFFSLAGFLYAFTVMGRRLPLTVLLGLVTLFSVLFGALSVAQGRVDDADILTILGEVAHRMLSSNQLGAVFGFRYVYTKEMVYGAEWLQTIGGFLPGVRGSTLSNEVFHQIFGGFRGTTPVSLWTSIYHNVGWLGLLPATVIIIKIIEAGHLILRYMPATNLHLVTYSFLSFYLAIIPATSPFQIINNGGLAVALVVFLAGFNIYNRSLFFRIS